MDIIETTVPRTRKYTSTQSGFTIVELLVVVAILAVLASSVISGLNGMVMTSALNNAQQDLVQSLRKSKSIARNQNTKVTMTLTQGSNQINLQSQDGNFLQIVALPSSVAVATNDDTYVFDPNGIVDKVGTITLASTQDQGQSRNITIQTLLGQIIVN